jgi:hypothetical protein
MERPGDTPFLGASSRWNDPTTGRHAHYAHCCTFVLIVAPSPIVEYLIFLRVRSCFSLAVHDVDAYWRSRWNDRETRPLRSLYFCTHFCAFPHCGVPHSFEGATMFSPLRYTTWTLTNHSTNKKVNYWLRYVPDFLIYT